MVRRLIALLIGTILLVGCHDYDDQYLLKLTNDARRQAGASVLVVDEVNWIAVHTHVQSMIDAGAIYHSNLNRIECECTTISENVGRGVTLEDIHEAWLASSAHRANMLGDWRYITVVVERGHDGYWYAVEVFWR